MQLRLTFDLFDIYCGLITDGSIDPTSSISIMDGHLGSSWQSPVGDWAAEGSWFKPRLEGVLVAGIVLEQATEPPKCSNRALATHPGVYPDSARIK